MGCLRKVHAFAKTLDDKVKQMIVRLKTLKFLGISYEKEKDLQIQKLYELDLPKDLVDFIVESIETKGKSFGLW